MLKRIVPLLAFSVVGCAVAPPSAYSDTSAATTGAKAPSEVMPAIAPRKIDPRTVTPGRASGIVTSSKAQLDSGIVHFPPLQTIPDIRFFDWAEDENPRIMMKVSAGACVLTQVGGTFDNDGDMVYIDVWDDYWVLTGTSSHAGHPLRAEAACTPWASFGIHGWNATWNNWFGRNAGDPPNTPVAELWGRDSFCSLGGVQGRLRDPNAWASVQTPTEHLYWPLNVNAVGQNNNVWADGICFNVNQGHNWNYYGEQRQPNPSVVDNYNTNLLCALTTIQGDLGQAQNSSVDSAGVYLDYEPNQYFWYLRPVASGWIGVGSPVIGGTTCAPLGQ